MCPYRSRCEHRSIQLLALLTLTNSKVNATLIILQQFVDGCHQLS